MDHKPSIVIVEPIYRKAESIFRSADDFRIITAPEEENLLAEKVEAENAFGVILGTMRYSGLLYEKMNPGGILARFGVGCDGLDFEKASLHNLLITNTPGVLDQTVAEFTVFLAGEVLRKIGQADQLMRANNWRTFLGNDLEQKTWAIIGFGNIGKRLCKILSHGFGVRVLGLNSGSLISKEIQADYGVEDMVSDYSRAVSQADIVSLHLPANPQTRHYLDRIRLEQIKPGALLINTARGSLVDESFLYDALQNGHLAGAGLDVFETEPYMPNPPDKDLRNLSNVILSPHLASSTVECCNRMARSVLADLRLALEMKYDQMHLVK